MHIAKRFWLGVVFAFGVAGLFAWQGGAWHPAQQVFAVSPAYGGETAAFKAQSNASLVVAGLVGQKVMNDRLVAVGTGRAKEAVALSPWSSGFLEKFFVTSGQKVKSGEAIAKLDSDREEINLEKANVNLNDAEFAMSRMTRLRASNTATEVQEINAKVTLENAKLGVRNAQLELDRRTIYSPIDGIVGILAVDPGNYVTASTELARIDNRSKILVDVWLPERFAPSVEIGGRISASSIVRSDSNYQGKIVAIDNMIDARSRTLQVRAELDNDDDLLRAGMSFGVTFKFPGDPRPTVDPLAVQWGGDGSYVWQIVNNVAVQVPVEIIQRNGDAVLVDAKLNKGDLIVVQGVQNMFPNLPVKVKNFDALQANKAQQS